MAVGVPTSATGQFADVRTGRSELGKAAAADRSDGLRLGTDSLSVPSLADIAGPDSAFSVLEVDSSVTRHPWSAAPGYPAEMLKKKQEGTVFVRYVVDTAARGTRVLEVLLSTHADFTAAVRRRSRHAVQPARIASTACRQLST